MKWLFILVFALVAYRLFAGRWPWGPRKLSAGAAARERAQVLLGVGDDAGRADIIEAHKRLVAQVHPDRGGTNEQVHEANSARDLLLKEVARRKPERP